MIINVLEQCLGYGKHSITVRCFFKINVGGVLVAVAL